MGKPVSVTIPHTLGKAEAKRRLQSGFRHLHSSFGDKFSVLEEHWIGDHMRFDAKLLGHAAQGTVDVGDDYVRLEVELPWVLAVLANKAKEMVREQGQLMLEKPVGK